MRGSVDQAWPFTAEYTAEREKPAARKGDRVMAGRNEGERDTTYFAIPRPLLHPPLTPSPIQKRAAAFLSLPPSLSRASPASLLASWNALSARSPLATISLERPLPRAYTALSRRPLRHRFDHRAIPLLTFSLSVFPSTSPLPPFRPVSPSVPFHRVQTTGLPSRSPSLRLTPGYLRPRTRTLGAPLLLAADAKPAVRYIYGGEANGPTYIYYAEPREL